MNDDMMNMSSSMMDHGHMNQTTMTMEGMMDHSADDMVSGLGGHSNHGLSSGSSDGFCSGEMGMVMFMEGFQWALKEGNGSCINLYFSGWTLDSRGKVVAAMIGVIALAILTEAISKLRHNLSQKARRATTTLQQYKQLFYVQTGLHGLHALTGYILMLATMTFAIELLLSVIVGLMIGYVLFGGDTYNHVTTNPCCAFLENEAEEREPLSSPSEQGGGGHIGNSGNCCDTSNTSKPTTTNNVVGGEEHTTDQETVLEIAGSDYSSSNELVLAGSTTTTAAGAALVPVEGV